MNEVTRELLLQVELAAVRGWPPLQSRAVDGWLWRYTSGGSIRANSVATLGDVMDVDEAIDLCQALYADRAVPSVFTLTEVSCPLDLDQRLADRGYLRGDDHVTMLKPVDPSARLPAAAALSRHPSDGWMRCYLSGLTEDRRAVAPHLIAGLPQPRTTFVVSMDGGEVGSCGVTIVDGAVASVQCMATQPQFRRRGGARTVLAAIESAAASAGARWLYLQTGGDNTAARALYERTGFTVASRYHTRSRRPG